MNNLLQKIKRTTNLQFTYKLFYSKNSQHHQKAFDLYSDLDSSFCHFD